MSTVRPKPKLNFNLSSLDDFPSPPVVIQNKKSTNSIEEKNYHDQNSQTTSNFSESSQEDLSLLEQTKSQCLIHLNPITQLKSVNQTEVTIPQNQTIKQLEVHNRPQTIPSFVAQRESIVPFRSQQTLSQNQQKIEKRKIGRKIPFITYKKIVLEQPKKYSSYNQKFHQKNSNLNMFGASNRLFVQLQKQEELCIRKSSYLISSSKNQLNLEINPLRQNGQNEDRNIQEQEEPVKTVLDIQLPNVFQKVIRGYFEKCFWFPYSHHYEYAKCKKYTPQFDKVKFIQTIKKRKLTFVNLNCDLNIASRGGNQQDPNYIDYDYKRKSKQYYLTSEEQRIIQLIDIIRTAMLNGVDFILLQQAYQSNIRKQILDLLNELEAKGAPKYFYPENLERFEYQRSTLILSRHPVRFGQIQFEITQHQNQDPSKFYFPLQAFCEFEIIIEGKRQTIGILNCHLRSNGEKNSETAPWKMRQRQLDCIHNWSKRQKYDKFFVIGDTNVPSGQKFKTQNLEALSKFVDAFDQGWSPMGGTYLFRTERNLVVDERLDRVLMNKQIEKKTVVKVEPREVLLKSCVGLGLDNRKMLKMSQQKLTYISPSDHKILDITIYLTKDQ